MRRLNVISLGLAGVCFAGMTACAGGDLPAKQMADTEAAVRAADEMNAKAVPNAALHLTLAREQLDAANKLIKAHEYERAQNVLARAQSDAELALALAQSDTAAKNAQAAMDKVGKLKQQSMAPAAGTPN